MPVSRRSGFDVGTSSALVELNNRPILRAGPPTALTASGGLSVAAASLGWGAYVEVVASTADEYGGLLVSMNVAASTVATSGVASIATGAAGSEVDVAIFNISSHGSGTATGTTPQIPIPVRIPKGSRIAIRSGNPAGTAHVSAFPAVPGLPLKLESMNYTVSFLVVPTTSIAASSTWTQLSAATNSAYRGLVLIPGANSGTMSAENAVTFTMGVGASGAEVSIGTCQVNTTTAESLTMRLGTTCDVIVRHIPKGSRLAVKQTSANTYFNATILGIPY